MSRKNRAKNRQREEPSSQQHQPARGAAPGTRRRRLSPLVIGIGLGVVALIAAVLLRPMFAGHNGTASPGTTPGDSMASAASALPPPAPGTKTPLNDVDPLTGKPITPASPTLDYKGYVIGFCCGTSSGYTGGWAAMSESQKDAFVRKYLK